MAASKEDDTLTDELEVQTASIKDEDQPWSEMQTKLLLTLYLAYLDDFNNPQKKRKDIWSKIAAELETTADACDKKFRNLKGYYLMILKRKSDTGWPYFHILDDIFHGDLNSYILETETEIQSESAQTEEAILAENDDDCKSEAAQKNDTVEVTECETDQDFIIDMSNTYDKVNTMLDSLIDHMEESNNIQKKRNVLLKKYYQLSLGDL